MLEQILQVDSQAFEVIHFQWSNSFFDWLMPILREKTTWIPLYLFIIGFSFWRFKLKSASLLIIALFITVGITDFVSSQLIKKAVDRPRPCQVNSFSTNIHELAPCGGGYSFPSSHAANHFGLAVFLLFSFGSIYRWIKFPLLLWATLIAIAQVYVGLHYPADSIGGAVLGSLIAFSVWRLYKNIILQHNPLY